LLYRASLLLRYKSDNQSVLRNATSDSGVHLINGETIAVVGRLGSLDFQPDLISHHLFRQMKSVEFLLAETWPYEAAGSSQSFALYEHALGGWQSPQMNAPHFLYQREDD